MATEKLKFRIELYATMWDRPPHVEVVVDNKSHYSADITGTEKAPTVIEFEHELAEGEDHNLFLNRSGKGRNQTVVNEKGDILKDQLLHIKSIQIDEIDIGALVYKGVYTPKYPEPWATQQRESGNDLKDSFENVTQMGFDGQWSLGFASPFYMWLLENLY